MIDGFPARSTASAAQKRPGLKPILFHDLRHTFGSIAITQAESVRELQDWMGRADARTTARYVHYKPRKGEARRLGEAFRIETADEASMLGSSGDERSLRVRVHPPRDGASRRGAPHYARLNTALQHIVPTQKLELDPVSAMWGRGTAAAPARKAARTRSAAPRVVHLSITDPGAVLDCARQPAP